MHHDIKKQIFHNFKKKSIINGQKQFSMGKANNFSTITLAVVGIFFGLVAVCFLPEASSVSLRKSVMSKLNIIIAFC